MGTEEGAAPVEVVPYRSRVNDSIITRAWEPVSQPQQRQPKVAAFTPQGDEVRRASQASLYADLHSRWIVGWSAQKGPGRVESVDQPPTHDARWLRDVVESWRVDWGAQHGAKFTEAAPEVSAVVPPGKFQRQILAAWSEPVYSVAEFGQGTEEGAAAQVDDPPPRALFQAHILRAWEPLRFRAEKFGAAIELPVEQPYRRDWLSGVVDQWKLTWGAQRAPVRIVQEGVDQPPKLTRPIASIVAQWESTWSAQTRGDFTEAAAAPPVDQPWPGRPWFAGVVDSWRVTWDAQRRAIAVTESGPVVEEKVPFSRLPAHLFRAWEPPFYSVVEYANSTEEGAAPAGTDQPWPGHRWLATVAKRWEPAPYRGERFGAVIDLTVVTPTPTDGTPPRYYGHRDVTVEEVQRQWELLEIKRRIREDPGPLETKVYTEVSVPKVLHKAVRDAIRIDLKFAPSLRAPSSAAAEPKIEEKKGLTREQIIALAIALDDDD